MKDELLTLAEMMRMLKVSKPTAYRYIAAKTFTAYKVGGQIRISKQSILDYLDQHKI